jgi:hypothetical protein
MLAKSPSQRFQTASEVAAALTPSTLQRHEIKPTPSDAENKKYESSLRRTLGKLSGALLLMGLFARQLSFQMHTGADARSLDPLGPEMASSIPGDSQATSDLAIPQAPQKAPEKTENTAQIDSHESSPALPRSSPPPAVETNPDDDAVPIIVPFPKRPSRSWRF